MTSKKTKPKLPASVGGSPLKALVSGCSTQGQRYWEQQSGKILLIYTLLVFPINTNIELVDPSARSPQAKQLPGRECSSSQEKIIELKFYWTRPCPPRAKLTFPSPVPSIGNLHKPLSLLHQRADDARRTTVLQLLKEKPFCGKLIRMKKQKVMFQMKG